MPGALLVVEEVREWEALPAGGEEGLREDILEAICYDETCGGE